MDSLRRVRFGAILAIIGAGLVLGSCDNKPATGGSHSPDAGGQTDALPEWHIGTVDDKLTDSANVRATLEHDTPTGGKIYLTADCSPNAIQINFEYHAKTKDRSYLDAEGSEAVVRIPYRFDQGEVREVLSKTQYNNDADILFAYALPDPHETPMDVVSNGAFVFAQALLPGIGPQDLRGFLHAQEVRFELPLGGGAKEVITVHPQEDSFQQFVRLCKIDLKRFDADAARARRATDAGTTPPAPVGAPEMPSPIDYGILGKPDLSQFTGLDPNAMTRSAADDLALFRTNEQNPPQGAEDRAIRWDEIAEHEDYQRALFYAGAAGAPDQVTQQDWIWARAEEQKLIASSCENAGSPGVRYQLSGRDCATVK